MQTSLGGVIGDTLGGVLSDRIYKRSGNLRLARLSVTILGFVGALASLLPIIWVHDINFVALCLSGGFLCAQLVIGPMWAIPMDVAPKYSGTAAGLMNTGSAFAAIASPLAAGYVIDLWKNWYLPFYMLMGVLALGAVSAFFMHPERPFALQSRGEGVDRRPFDEAFEPYPADRCQLAESLPAVFPIVSLSR